MEMIFYCQSCGEQHTQPSPSAVSLTSCSKCGGRNFATWKPPAPCAKYAIESLERSLARRDALLREISREISWDEKVGDYWKRRIERELEKK
jgi:predicted  nucleic acid-binding Zn-ribbon protein